MADPTPAPADPRLPSVAESPAVLPAGSLTPAGVGVTAAAATGSASSTVLRVNSRQGWNSASANAIPMTTTTVTAVQQPSSAIWVC